MIETNTSSIHQDTGTLKRYALIAAFAWTLILASSLTWDFIHQQQHTEEIGRTIALAYFNKDRAFRTWVASHGGLYVPVSEKVRPSPLMESVHERDVITESGRMLTLLSSLQVLRLVNEEFETLFGVAGQVTGLNPLRPENEPDAWEHQAIQDFQNGATEKYETLTVDGIYQARFMRPLYFKTGCMGCHQNQGFKVGDLAGGFSVIVPMTAQAVAAREHNIFTGLLHGGYWILGIGAIGFGYRGTRRRMTERAEAQRELLHAHNYNRDVISALGEGLYGVDGQGHLTFLNAAGEKLLGWKESELAGRIVHEIIHHERQDGADFPWAQCPLHTVMGAEAPYRNDDDLFIRKDGVRLPVSTIATPLKQDDRTVGAVIAFQDIRGRKQAEKRIHYLAHYDELTDLPNRTLLGEFLDHYLVRAARYKSKLAVLFIDLDNFSLVNDTRGHVTGDHLLLEVANRLRQVIREPDVLARQGGDEFIVLLTPPGTSAEQSADSSQEDLSQLASEVARRLLLALDPPFSIDGQEFFVTASIGISRFPTDGQTGVTLLQNADSAMYQAKGKGGGRYALYGEELFLKFQRQQEMEARLHRAVREQDFVLRYQPIVELATRRLVGVEALIRWKDQDQGLIMPEEFIESAERTGLINQLGLWVLREACQQAKVWREQRDGFYVAINLSVRQFLRGDLVSEVMSGIKACGISADLIELEITEGSSIDDADHVQLLLNSLHSKGFRLALDDFGTGFSSLSRLRQLPVSTLKIDKSFVVGIPDEKDDVEIVLSTVQLAKNLGKTPLAEGIETEAQLAFLLELGCDLGQGFYFSPPVTAGAIDAMLRVPHI